MPGHRRNAFLNTTAIGFSNESVGMRAVDAGIGQCLPKSLDSGCFLFCCTSNVVAAPLTMSVEGGIK